jgi:ribA/ribD-fused uncharacterized protein
LITFIGHVTIDRVQWLLLSHRPSPALTFSHTFKPRLSHFQTSSLSLSPSTMSSTPSLKRPRDVNTDNEPRAKKQKPSPIVFFSRSADAASKQLSNFAPSPILIDGRWYPTVEHYYQSQKFSQRKDLAAQFSTESQGEVPVIGAEGIHAKRAGSKKAMKMIKVGLVTGWEAKAPAVMKVALSAKFEQHPYSRACLLKTGEKPLHHFERRPGVWGCHSDKATGVVTKGGNKMGELLEEVREAMRA